MVGYDDYTIISRFECHCHGMTETFAPIEFEHHLSVITISVHCILDFSLHRLAVDILIHHINFFTSACFKSQLFQVIRHSSGSILDCNTLNFRNEKNWQKHKMRFSLIPWPHEGVNMCCKDGDIKLHIGKEFIIC